LHALSLRLHNEAMLWEGRPLRDIREGDLRRLIESGLTEHLQLEYKEALYGDNDRSRKEFLLDVGMFANTAGGIMLIGVPERRDPQGRPTGAPDPAAILGMDVPNPEATLSAYDARVMESIEERLALESVAIDVGEGRRVLAIRVPNSANKPHSVRHEGHIYFPARRERQRYHMSVREIKELVMRTASSLQQAERMLETSFLGVARSGDLPYLIIGILPLFFSDFLVDVRANNVCRSVEFFSRAPEPEQGNVFYTFDGLERRENRFEYTVRLRRDGLLVISVQLPLANPRTPRDILHRFFPVTIDTQLRTFALKASVVYQAATIGGPYVLGMMLRVPQLLVGSYPDALGLGEVDTPPVRERDYLFPFMQVDDLSGTDRAIRPLCDQVHQMFGRKGSPNFNADGEWIGR